MCWTSYTEQLNEVIEHLNFTSTYWGDKDRFKFRTSVSDFNVINEVGEGTERINRVEFSLNVKAYLLPEKFDGQNTTKKSISVKRVVLTTETDVTGNGRLEGLLTTPSPYYDNKDLIDFLSINNSTILTGSVSESITFSNIKPIKTPPSLTSVMGSGINVGDDSYDIKVYVNGVRYYPTTHFSSNLSSTSATFTFIPANIGFHISGSDEIAITGKFINL
jgi:hypothetical protein